MTFQSSTDAFAPFQKIPVSPVIWAWQISLIVSMLIFTSWSSVDIAFSALFFDGSSFPASKVMFYNIIRKAIWITGLLVAALCLIGATTCIVRRSFMGIASREWYYAASLILLGPAALVNEVLKNTWGRARPADILEFGGKLQFTPALVPTDQCLRNCSFVSGEGAGAVTLAVVVWRLTKHIENPNLRIALRTAIIGLASIGSFLRIATGRHFLSDTVFAVLIITGLALLLRPILTPSNHVKEN